MQASFPILLLDTNVWLDLFLPRRHSAGAARRLVNEALAANISLTYSAHSLLDVYQKVQRYNKKWIRETRELTQLDAITIKRMAWDSVNSMNEIATAIGVDHSDVKLACKLRDTQDDLEDDFVLAACQRAKADYLVTSDKDLLGHSFIEAHTPADMLDLIRTGRAKSTRTSSDTPDENDWFYRWLELYA